MRLDPAKQPPSPGSAPLQIERERLREPMKDLRGRDQRELTWTRDMRPTKIVRLAELDAIARRQQEKPKRL
jgi:hypothetical protein